MLTLALTAMSSLPGPPTAGGLPLSGYRFPPKLLFSDRTALDTRGRFGLPMLHPAKVARFGQPVRETAACFILLKPTGSYSGAPTTSWFSPGSAAVGSTFIRSQVRTAHLQS